MVFTIGRERKTRDQLDRIGLGFTSQRRHRRQLRHEPAGASTAHSNNRRKRGGAFNGGVSTVGVSRYKEVGAGWRPGRPPWRRCAWLGARQPAPLGHTSNHCGKGSAIPNDRGPRQNGQGWGWADAATVVASGGKNKKRQGRVCWEASMCCCFRVQKKGGMAAHGRRCRGRHGAQCEKV